MKTVGKMNRSYDEFDVLADDPFTTRWNPALSGVAFRREPVDSSDQEYNAVIANIMAAGGQQWTKKVKQVETKDVVLNLLKSITRWVKILSCLVNVNPKVTHSYVYLSTIIFL